MRKLIKSTVVTGITPTNKQIDYFKELERIDNMIEKYPNCNVLKETRSLTSFLIKMN